MKGKSLQQMVLENLNSHKQKSETKSFVKIIQKKIQDYRYIYIYITWSHKCTEEIIKNTKNGNTVRSIKIPLWGIHRINETQCEKLSAPLVFIAAL